MFGNFDTVIAELTKLREALNENTIEMQRLQKDLVQLRSMVEVTAKQVFNKPSN